METSPSMTPRPSLSLPNSASDVPQASAVTPDSRDSSSAAAAPPSAAPAQLGLPRALKPVGIVNEQNTCFLNSTFQALSATAPLISLLNSSPDGPLFPTPISILPPPAIQHARIPALLPESLEPPLYPLLPVTRTFLTCLQKSWKMKDAGGGTSGSGETSSSRSMRLNHLLREMARKYDQYDDYMQQDAHELLRHLLDSMEMEEKDIIKRVQPQPPPMKKRKSVTRGDFISPLPSPAPSAPASPTKVTFAENGGPAAYDKSRADSIASSTAGSGAEIREIPENERMVPFVDVLFGGVLASVVVCETCKSVSHTYEPFSDISLSMKGDAPRPRKRDRLKAALGLKKRGSASKASGSEAGGNMSEPELSDSEHKLHWGDRSRRGSMDVDERPINDESSELKRNSSMSVFGIKGKPSFSFKKRSVSKSAGASSSSLPVDPDKTPPASAASVPGSPNTFAKMHTNGPTPAQAAYISRILSGSLASHSHDDPFAKLKAANSGAGLTVNVKTETGLEESLRNFTSVEVLEGNNSFACRKCWKVKSGRPGHGHDTVLEEDETMEALNEPALRAPHAMPPAISVVGSDTSSDQAISLGEDDRDRLGRARSSASRSSAASSVARNPSPLRRLVDEGQTSGMSAIERSYAASAISAESGAVADPEFDDASDGLSGTSSSEDEPPPVNLPGNVRPKMPKRRKSSHFVMRRAFKRYLIAQAPEVLVFHFKRFKQTNKSNMPFTSFYDLKKMDDFVSFPETFDLAPYLAPNRNDYKCVPTPSGLHAPFMDWPSPDHGPDHHAPVMYRLYALVVHMGSMIGGHYIAYVLVDPEIMFGDGPQPKPVPAEHSDLADKVADLKVDDKISQHAPSVPNSRVGSPTSSKKSLPEANGEYKRDRRVWCYCSDTTIRLASVEEVLAAKAYICFYEKIPV